MVHRVALAMVVGEFGPGDGAVGGDVAVGGQGVDGPSGVGEGGGEGFLDGSFG